MSVEVQQIDLEAAQFKADATVQTGLRMLEFYAAAFSKTADSNGDIIDPHAFDAWLQEFYAAGKPLPISFSHSAVLDALDPTNTIGYAPADPQHVWVDDYGLRVRGFLDTASEKGKAVEWQIENDLMGGASMAYIVPPGGRILIDEKSGTHRITVISSVRETGPTPNPANQEAVLLWMKSEHLLEEAPDLPYMTVEEFRETFLKAVDSGAWDGAAAMGACSTAAQYRSIAFERNNDSAPDTAAHWALPHHFLGKGPNAQGVAAAVGALNGARGGAPDLKNTGAARAHLAAHQSAIQATKSAEPEPQQVVEGLRNVPSIPDLVGGLEHGLKHAASPTYIQAAHDALVRGGAKCAAGGAETASAPRDEVAERLRRLRFMKITTT